MRPRVLLVLVPLLACGCVERLWVIRSEPSGATVLIDGQVRGETPHTETYVHYGTREVTLLKPGFRSHRRMFDLNAPWWQIFPFDLITDVVLPFTLTDRVEMTVTLEKEPAADGAFRETLKRALEARDKATPPGDGSK